ncbi:tRNA 2-selenouridine(34) synthase MnmH [Prochlorococcus sp. MIT 1341]|uniref:tRNA 2-selenouridine(34) synthase MnmH n=1 Tax=Prochlorococcus sp. MIT 1341 TaxID=3096221 RepID=UPI002A749F0B|nr:tRNA 2-selenouridine(34) synthase MnmH [Prochlorococcus sp. MIT 1341]
MSGIGIHSVYPLKQFRVTNGPLVDVRSPSEFSQGHYPGSINLPLFSDEERKEVGKTYKKAGREKAILLGLKYTGPKMERLASSLLKIARTEGITTKGNHPNQIRIYCWRGGMRSSSMAWLAELIDLNPILLNGGYKSYRNWALEQFGKSFSLKLIGGRTGTGKTDLLIALEKQGEAVIDLEGVANHRGSSFGGFGLPKQPTSEQFENLLAEELQKCIDKQATKIWLEDESANLGLCRIPHLLFQQMKKAPILEITRTEKERIEKLVEVYSHFGKHSLEEATLRIARRLGPQRTSRAIASIHEEDWAEACKEIINYYDRCYDHQLDNAPSRISINVSGLNPTKAAKKLLLETI